MTQRKGTSSFRVGHRGRRQRSLSFESVEARLLMAGDLMSTGDLPASQRDPAVHEAPDAIVRDGSASVPLPGESDPNRDTALHKADPSVSRAPQDGPTLGYDPTCKYSIGPDNVVTITGGMGADDVAVIEDYTTGIVAITLDCADGQLAGPWLFAQGVVPKIVFHGGWGNDSFLNLSGIPSEAYGDGDDDTLIGGLAGDKLHGGNGHDLLKANGMSWGLPFVGDELYGDAGDDVLVGSVGHDSLFGGAGFDQLFGGAGDDYLEGGYDSFMDQLEGGSGSDVFVNEWREHIGNGQWVPKEFEQLVDFALGDTLQWKEIPS